MRLQLALAVLVALPSVAHADGVLTMRGVYYKERATRVEQPMLDGTFDVGENSTVDAHFLIDAITSASTASGATDTTFSEKRVEGGGGYTRRVGGSSASVAGKISIEPDYRSYWIDARISREFAQKNLVATLGGGVGHDDVYMLAATGLGGLTAAMSVGTLNTVLGSASVSQIVSKNAVAALTYDLAYLTGYQQNPYRTAITADGLVPERHPTERMRQAIAASVRRFVPRTNTTVIATYRFYFDDWGVIAHTPELRLVQEVGDGADFTLRYRYYHQSAADFFLPTYPSSDPNLYPYVSDDVKLSNFQSQTLGVKLGVYGKELGLEGRLEEARGEIVLEYVAQDTRFGNAVIAHAALALPFEY